MSSLAGLSGLQLATWPRPALPPPVPKGPSLCLAAVGGEKAGRGLYSPGAAAQLLWAAARGTQKRMVAGLIRG
jgi:hypothetical protein